MYYGSTEFNNFDLVLKKYTIFLSSKDGIMIDYIKSVINIQILILSLHNNNDNLMLNK